MQVGVSCKEARLPCRKGVAGHLQTGRGSGPTTTRAPGRGRGCCQTCGHRGRCLQRTWLRAAGLKQSWLLPAGCWPAWQQPLGSSPEWRPGEPAVHAASHCGGTWARPAGWAGPLVRLARWPHPCSARSRGLPAWGWRRCPPGRSPSAGPTAAGREAGSGGGIGLPVQGNLHVGTLGSHPQARADLRGNGREEAAPGGLGPLGALGQQRGDRGRAVGRHTRGLRRQAGRGSGQGAQRKGTHHGDNQG